MGSIERRERERLETREKILTAARALFATHGYDAVSMRQIAEAIEYSPTAIYVHFRDKESLFAELATGDFAALAERFEKIEQVVDPVERLRRIGQAYVEFALKHPNHYRLMFMTPGVCKSSASLNHEAANPDCDGYGRLRAAVAQSVEAGKFSNNFKDVDLVAQTLWAGMHGVASLQIVKGQEDWLRWRPIRQRATAMLDALMEGMLK